MDETRYLYSDHGRAKNASLITSKNIIDQTLCRYKYHIYFAHYLRWMNLPSILQLLILMLYGKCSFIPCQPSKYTPLIDYKARICFQYFSISHNDDIFWKIIYNITKLDNYDVFRNNSKMTDLNIRKIELQYHGKLNNMPL